MKPTDVIKPMLATRSPAGESLETLLTTLGPDWVFEPKLDGYRCLMHVIEGAMVLRSRTGSDVSSRFVATKAPKTSSSMVVDGELIAFDDQGRPSFGHLQRTHGRRGDPTPSFVAFDLLYHPKLLDIRGEPWTRRRDLLEELASVNLTVVPYSESGPVMWDAVVAQGMEGALAKNRHAPYQSGRSHDWIKLKRVRTLSAIATGFNTGEGSRAATFGSLALSLVDDAGDLRQIGDVGGGFTQADLEAIRPLELPFVVEVQFLGWTGAALRMPVFKGLREDISLTDCTFKQQLPGMIFDGPADGVAGNQTD